MPQPRYGYIVVGNKNLHHKDESVMKIIIPPLSERTNGISDPFDLDVFGRKEFADNVTSLFRNCDNGLVVTVDSEWGGGKTTLVRLWEQQLLRDSQFIPIYYDAFKNDFAGDAFMSIAVLIHEVLRKRLDEHGANPENAEQLTRLKEGVFRIAKGALRMATGAAANAISAGMISGRLVEDTVSQVTNLMFDVLETDIDERFKAHAESIKLVEDYQKALRKVVQIGAVAGRPNKIVFFIDELDRCRPDFAVEVIEKVKHLFNVDHVSFVLSVNRKQLLSTISSAYGVEKDDAETYLEKFVHIETKLPSGDLHSLEADISKLKTHCKQLWIEFGLNTYATVSDDTWSAIAELMSLKNLGLTPRAIERTFGYISIICAHDKSIGDKNILKLVFLLSALRVSYPETYQSYRDGLFRSSGSDKKSLQVFKWIELNIDEPVRQSKALNAYQIDSALAFYRILGMYEFPKLAVAAEESPLLEVCEPQ